jgi:hypothetical protein
VDEGKSARLSRQRQVLVNVSRETEQYREPNILAALLLTARAAAWKEWPLFYYIIDPNSHSLETRGGSIDIYVSGERAVHVADFNMDGFALIEDERAEREAEAARAAALAEREVQAAPPSLPSTTRPLPPLQPAPQMGPPAQPRSGWGGVWTLLIILGGIVLWSNRENVVRFIYAALRFWYALTPHPARAAVDRAIRSGETIDVDELKQSLSTHAANRIEREVRDQQLREATQRLREHEAMLRREAEARAERERRRAAARAAAERLNQFGQSEEELLKAALEHQIAAARAEAMRKKDRL